MDPEITQAAPITPEINQVQPETIPIQPVPSPPRSNFPLILAVIILLIVVGAVGIFLGKSLNNSQKSTRPTVAPLPTQIPTPSPDETVNWQVYQNKKYGFQFKYPTEYILSDRFFEITSEKSEGKSIFIIKKINKEVGQPPTIYFGIATTQKTIPEFIDYEHAREIAWWKEFQGESGLYTDDPEPSIKSIEDVKSGTLTGKKVVRQRAPNAPNSNEIQYFIKNIDLLYIFSVRYGTYNPDTKEDGTDEKNTLDKIFTTFKFTSP